MDVCQLSVKFLAENSDGFDPARLIPIFHRYIRDGFLSHRLPIDVADYRHVVSGPGVLIICDGCHFGIDFEDDVGLLYSRKRDPVGPLRQKLDEAFADTLLIAQKLETEAGLGLTLDPGRFEIRLMSRLEADNSKATFLAFKPELEAFLAKLYGAAPTEILYLEDARAPFGVRVRMSGAPTFAALAARAA